MEQIAVQPLNVVLFGATGMVGSAVLAYCLESVEVASVLSIGRHPLGIKHPKLEELIRTDFFDYSDAEERLRGRDVCLFTLGRSSVGLSEEEYTRDTHDLTLAAARALLAASPGLGFCYISGQGTDSTAAGRVMWARVKGRTENELLTLPFGHAAMIRLGALQPPEGYRSRVRWIRWSYRLLGPLLPLLRRFGPSGLVLDGTTLSRAMLRAGRGLAPKPVLEPRDLAQLGA